MKILKKGKLDLVKLLQITNANQKVVEKSHSMYEIHAEDFLKSIWKVGDLILKKKLLKFQLIIFQ